MKISNEIIMLATCALLVIAALVAINTWGVPSEPLACEVGPMEAAQCRSQGRPVARARYRSGHPTHAQ